MHVQERDRAFLASLSYCDGDSSDDDTDSDDDDEKKIVGHAGLCFLGDEYGYCTMAFGGDQAGSTHTDNSTKANSDAEVSECDEEALFTALKNQDRLL